MSIRDINRWLSSKNIAEELDDQLLGEIGTKVHEEYLLDKRSRSEWESKIEEAQKLATQVKEAKNTPYANAANVKYPLLATAAVQFAARALPNIIGPGGIVKCKVTGQDPSGAKASRADRVAAHMNYQLGEVMEEWEDETDALLSALAIEGAEFKKTFYDPELRRPKSILIRPRDLVVNFHTKKLETAPRITHVFELFPHQIEERIRAKLFRDVELGQPVSSLDGEEEGRTSADLEKPHIFLEQHRYWDLDGDGLREPYIITVHKDSMKVVRIVARYNTDGISIDEGGKITKIKPIQYFTHFPFMHSITGSIYALGFGILLGPINNVISTLINQILDAGSLDNAGGGFIGGGVNFGPGKTGGELKFKLGEWKPVNYAGDDIRKQILPKPKIEPSQVLFALLGAMVEAGEKLASTAEVLEGKVPGTRTPATTVLALIEQGLKVFSSIHKRIHRSLKSEYQKIYRINGLYADEGTYFRFHDKEGVTSAEDYAIEDLDIVPVSDPNEVSDTQKVLKAQILMSMLGQGFNDQAIKRRFLEAMRITDIEEILPQEGAMPPVDPKIQLELQKLELERDKFQLDVLETKFKVMETQARAVKALAQAQESLDKSDVELTKTRMQALSQLLGKAFDADIKQQIAKESKKDGGGKSSKGTETTTKGT